MSVAGSRAGTAPDRAFAGVVHARLGEQDLLLRLLVLPTEPAVLIAAIMALVVASLARRRVSAAVLAVAGPAVTVTLTSGVLKPVFGRFHGDHLAYPSGHTAGLVSVLAVLAVLGGSATLRRAAIGAGAALLPLVAVGMVGLHYHYLTDVVGGAACAVALTLAVIALPRCRSAGRRRRGGVAGEGGEPADRAQVLLPVATRQHLVAEEVSQRGS
jgi:membrane-associated phospholipid phosphatase